MQLVYLVLLLCAVVALNWRFLGLNRVFGRRGGGVSLGLGKPCRWKKDPMRKGDRIERYVCATCGVDAFTSNGRAPRQCKRSMRSGAL